MAYGDYLDTNGYVAYPLVQITGVAGLINPFNGAIYASEGEAAAATGGHVVKTFATMADFQAQLALNGGNVLRLFGLGGRTPANAVATGTVAPGTVGVGTPGILSFLDGQIFGIDKKLVAAAVALYFLLGK